MGYSSQHQQRRGVALRAAVTVPVSPPNCVDLHEWDSAGHPGPLRQKALFLQATTGVSHPYARKYRALNDRVARVRLQIVLVAHIDKWYCNSKYSDLYEHYANSVKLVVNNRLSIMLSYVV